MSALPEAGTTWPPSTVVVAACRPSRAGAGSSAAGEARTKPLGALVFRGRARPPAGSAVAKRTAGSPNWPACLRRVKLVVEVSAPIRRLRHRSSGAFRRQSHPGFVQWLRWGSRLPELVAGVSAAERVPDLLRSQGSEGVRQPRRLLRVAPTRNAAELRPRRRARRLPPRPRRRRGTGVVCQSRTNLPRPR